MSTTTLPRRPWPGRPSLALLMTITALFGGAASTGVLALTGALGDGAQATSTTVVPASSGTTSDTSSSSSSGVDAKAIYANTSAGVVDITAKGTGSSQSTATGSGFVVDGQGDIVTAAHVIDGASSIKVTFSDGVTRTATLAGKDDATDVAVLKVDPS
ncbi:MAG TPA: trypsin-like peptidase domain-containing protein, partial [Solirubrobacteraceae bacterium]|nr:trypsin-like peptidase domain-containing protein [Solirubrobacteraceae bacterium]